MTAPRVHDLVRVSATTAERSSDAPAWAISSLRRTPWVVVRRENCAEQFLPVGVRGERRGERFATTIAASDALAIVTPEDAATSGGGDPRLSVVFDRASDCARACGLRALPIGSFGFERATGAHVTGSASDLDLLIRASRASRENLRAFAAALDDVARATGVAIDVELEFDAGAAPLAEIVAGKPSVLFKTSDGPRLLACPL